MARGLENDEFAVRYLPVHIVADCHGGDHILTALENEGRDRNLREVGAIVGVKRDARELLCDIGIVRQKLLVSSAASSGRSALPIITGAMAVDHPM